MHMCKSAHRGPAASCNVTHCMRGPRTALWVGGHNCCACGCGCDWEQAGGGWGHAAVASLALADTPAALVVVASTAALNRFCLWRVAQGDWCPKKFGCRRFAACPLAGVAYTGALDVACLLARLWDATQL